jgi:hypothetical protein
MPLHTGLLLTKRDLGSQPIGPNTIHLRGSCQILASMLRRYTGTISR